MTQTDGPSVSAGALRHMLAVAEQEAATAAGEVLAALVRWGDAMEAFRAGSGTAESAVRADQEYSAALAHRLLADAKVEFLRKHAEGRS